MNLSTEDLRKLLEDCWDAAQRAGTTKRDPYITSQLSALHGKGEGELPEFLVVKDSDNHYFIWPKNRYNKYVANAVDVGACPAIKIIVGFNGDEDFLFPTTTLPPANQPTGMSQVDKARIIGLCNGSIQAWEQFGSRNINPEGLVDNIIEIKTIVEKSDETK